MKKWLSVLLAVCCVMMSSLTAHAEKATSASAFVLYCVNNGEILSSDNAQVQLPMASTTKIMTTLLTLEEYAKENRTVEFCDEMSAEGSSMYLGRGEKVTLYDLAVGMMLQSGNDAANAAAIAIGGSIESFADMMNAKAREIGMKHTHFVTPSGLDDPEHYSTAYDMALLMSYALQNDDFAYITRQTSMEVRFVYPADKFVTYQNHNKLLRIYDDCIGGKTGYTDKAGRCLVSAAERDGLYLIAVTLNDHDDWDDHVGLYEEGFNNFRSVTPSVDVGALPVAGGIEDEIDLSVGQESMVVPADADDVRVQVCLPSFLYAPVTAGKSVGEVVVSQNGTVIKRIPITAAESVDDDRTKRSLIQYIKDKINWHN